MQWRRRWRLRLPIRRGDCDFTLEMIKQKDGFQGERSIVLAPMIVDAVRRDPLASSLYVTDIGYYPAAFHHYRSREEAPIDQHVLIYCVEGNGWYRLDGKEYAVGPNEFFILPAGVPHAYGSQGEGAWTIYWLHFAGQHASIYAEGEKTPKRINVTVDSRIGRRNNLFEEILNTLMEGQDMARLRYVSSLLHYYLATMCYVQEYRRSTALEASTDPVLAAVHYMEENLERRLKLQDILDYVGYSSSHFTTLFRQQMGMPPLSYFNHLKVQQACALLRETDMHINQICYKLGIEDCYYFSRMFTKEMGVSPQKYRDKED